MGLSWKQKFNMAVGWSEWAKSLDGAAKSIDMTTPTLNKRLENKSLTPEQLTALAEYFDVQIRLVTTFPEGSKDITICFKDGTEI